MASFKQHIGGGIIIGFLSAICAMLGSGISVLQTGIVFILGVLGSVLPDIDCDTSTPLKFLFGYIGIVLPVVFLQSFYTNATMEMTMLFLVLGYFFIRDIVSSLFLKFTSHRGIIHSIPMAIVFGELTFLLFYDSMLNVRIVFSIACMIGFLTHLIMDEIWSIDLMGGHIKRSFGSAITFSCDSKIKTFFVYFTIIGLGIVIIFMNKNKY